MPKAPLSPGGLASYSDSPPLLWHELPMLKLDAIDRQILAALQYNGRISNVELAERVGLSPSPCLRRVRQLEEAGMTTRYVALLNQLAVGLPDSVSISTKPPRRPEDHLHRLEPR